MSNPLLGVPLNELRERTSVKWREYPPDVLPMFVAEMDVRIAEPVQDAIVAAVRSSDTGYPHGTAYAEALAEFAGRRWDWDLAPDQQTSVADVMTGITEALRLVTDPGDAVVLNPPVYAPFYDFTEHAGRHIVRAPLGPDGRIDFAVLEAAFKHGRSGGRRCAYLLCNPHNPTGTVPTRTELEQVAELARGWGVRVVADEIHAPLVLPGAVFTPYAQVDPLGLVLMSASKAWNLAGFKAAQLIAGRDAVADLRRVPELVSHGPSHSGVIAHVAALREGGAWLDELLAGLAENRALLQALLAEHLPAVRLIPPEGTYLSWLDCRDLGIEGEPADFFLEHGRVAFVRGPVFGGGGAGHVRLNYATSPELLTEGVRRMAAALRG
ncbi:MalY/PatB family protein [Hamadaea tsunoensis]|uniref:MalY/PatB family protein n=1 Tax=Hamadaea tsunoensis TaxID=53368 RepID=UPI00041099DC|nr:MalY/PatB family protein [Hamadaea tsunoensis]